MRRYALALGMVGLMAFSAVQAQPIPTYLIPNPIAVALTIGQWLLKDSRKVYYVQVKSTATTPALARAEAFKLAVNQAVGTLVLAESEVKNNELIRKDIIQYSSGYVEDFKVLQETQVDGGVQIVMDVWVSDSKIADRLLYVSKGNNIIDGAKAATQHQSLLNEKNSGDRLLAAVLNDFPVRAFDVSVDKTQWRTTGRTLEIYIPISIGWNSAYINALYEVLMATRDGNNSFDQKYVKRYSSVVMLKRKGDFFKTYAAYNDSYKADMILKALYSSDPMVLLQIKDVANSVIYTKCFKLEHMRGGYYGEPTIFGHYATDRFDIPGGQFFSISPPDASVGIYGDYKLDQTIRLAIEGPNTIVENMKAVEVRIVNNKECKRIK
jgi:hypothetical protein